VMTAGRWMATTISSVFRGLKQVGQQHNQRPGKRRQ
jgi:hypothetical protein